MSTKRPLLYNRTREICPVCQKRLANHAAAIAHYRAHARKGELEQAPSERDWRLPGGEWFSFGEEI